jgi:mono/diheme cytochrome c family protein
VQPVAYSSGDAALARGKYLFESRGCADCHGADGAGHDVINSANGLYVKSPNITSGPGGVVAAYQESDWVRTIRHGVKPDRHPVLVMPAEDYSRWTDADLAAAVAYVRSLPPAKGEGAQIRFPLIVKALYALDLIQDAAEKIDHTLPPPREVAEAVSVEHGAYVANMCMGCHGSGLSGGKIPGAPPDWPAAANLTPGSGSIMLLYDTPEKFVAMLHTGKRPDGSDVSAVMPLWSLRHMSELDARAIYVFLKSLPPRPAGQR